MELLYLLIKTIKGRFLMKYLLPLHQLMNTDYFFAFMSKQIYHSGGKPSEIRCNGGSVPLKNVYLV